MATMATANAPPANSATPNAPSANAPSANAPPANSVTANAPPANAPPANSVTANAPPANNATANAPPANCATANAPPANSVTANAPPANSSTQRQEIWEQRFCLFVCLVSFLCALGIFTESQFYAYTIGIHGTYAHIIYYVVGVTLSSVIQVILIQPGCCRTFLEKYDGCFILKSCGGFFVMFTICFLSSGTGLHYLGLSSYGTAELAVAVAFAPYRSQAFAEVAGLLASALLTVNALSIIIRVKSDKLNKIFDVAATLTLGSSMDLLYKYPYVTVAAAVFIMAMTLLKNYLLPRNNS